VAALAVVLGGGCGAENGPAEASAEDTGDLSYRPCPAAEHLGQFRVELAAAFTGVQGRIANGVLPLNVPDEVDQRGQCRLLRPPSLFCDPACAAGETCTSDGQCIPHPRTRSVGSVTIEGLITPLSMEPSEPGNVYTNRDPLPHPGFADGAAIVLRADGGEFEPFTLRGWGVSPLEGTPDRLALAANQRAKLQWAAPDDAGPAQVHIEVNVNRHGGVATWLECDVPDSGQFEIAQELTTALVSAGLSGFPSAILTRRTVDSVSLNEGCVDFEVSARVELAIAIPGLISCTETHECPAGQTCQPDLTCGE
jgi:hypothetical protein